MDALVYPREKTLGTITLVLGIIFWLALIFGTFGIALLGLGIGFLLYLFAQSALISHIKGNGVQLTESQFPDLYAQFVFCCDQLKIQKYPEAYVLNGNGGLNAFATKFLGNQYVVLYSDVVDAMNRHPDGVQFYIGHELGHLRMKHLTGHLYRWPALWLPLLGAAYSRARESTCDRHGAACSTSPENSARAIAALSAGSQRWEHLNINAYITQAYQSSGFWMSFHELTAGYPWLTKRATRVMEPNAHMPSRHGLAYFFALFVPYAGRLGGGFGVLILIYIIGILAAVAIPAYSDYKVKAELTNIVAQAHAATAALGNYYQANQKLPESLDSVGVQTILVDGTTYTLAVEQMILTAHKKKNSLVFIPSTDKEGHVLWTCQGGEGMRPAQIPKSCIEFDN